MTRMLLFAVACSFLVSCWDGDKNRAEKHIEKRGGRFSFEQIYPAKDIDGLIADHLVDGEISLWKKVEINRSIFPDWIVEAKPDFVQVDEYGVHLSYLGLPDDMPFTISIVSNNESFLRRLQGTPFRGNIVSGNVWIITD